MIRISKIDDKLDIYHKNTIYIWGAGKNGKYIQKLMKSFEIYVEAFVDNSVKVQGRHLNGIEVISPRELYERYDKDNNIIVQLGLNRKNEAEVIEEIAECRLEYILYEEACKRLLDLKKKDALERGNFADNQIWELKSFFDNIMYESRAYLTGNIDKDNLFMCMPPKTGNVTLVNTLNSMNIRFCNLWHSPFEAANIREKAFELWNQKKVKIIMAVREPVAQNLSMLFQAIGGPPFFIMRKEFWQNGGDVQKIFDFFIDALGYNESSNTVIGLGEYEKQWLSLKCSDCFLIQQFIDVFRNNIVDIFKYPFDKEKGYSTICEDNMEIFVFQLEKLSSISKELGDWIGCDEELVLKKGNIREHSWLQEAYKCTIDQLDISKQYFEKCFAEPYVEHFYSKQDINLFKEKWIGHVRT